MRTRRWVGLVIVIAALGSLAPITARPPSPSSGPTISLVAPPGLCPSGASIPVELWISGAADLGAFQIDLQYDHTRLELTDVTGGTFLGALSSCNPSLQRCVVGLGPHEQAGLTGLGGYSYGTGSGASGTGLLAVLHFRSTGGGGPFGLHLANALITDTHAVPATPATQDATLSIEARVYLPFVRR